MKEISRLNSESKLSPGLADVEEAYKTICNFIHHTPVLTSRTLDRLTGNRLFFKCENFQKAGAFKFRGASHAVLTIKGKCARHGVLTHSSGNHAAALALAARLRNIPAYIVMPKNAPAVKKAAVQGYGGIITECEPTLSSREATAERVKKETGATLIHPYNNETIIAGQGTAALELLDQVEALDAVLTPVGGGGLLSGTAITAKGRNKKIQVFGCEPENADDAYRSLQAGRIVPMVNSDTIADGLRTSLGDKTFPIICRLVDDILLVSEREIIRAMRLLWERMKIVVEPSGAVPLAALLRRRKELQGKRIGIILSGGNVDLSRLPF